MQHYKCRDWLNERGLSREILRGFSAGQSHIYKEFGQLRCGRHCCTQIYKTYCTIGGLHNYILLLLDSIIIVIMILITVVKYYAEKWTCSYHLLVRVSSHWVQQWRQLTKLFIYMALRQECWRRPLSEENEGRTNCPRCFLEVV